VTTSPDRASHLDVAIERETAVITFRRPEALNALDVPTRLELARLIRQHGSSGEVRGIVLTGEGRAFSAGEDLKAVSTSSDADPLAAVETFHDVTRAILETRVPVVAALNGIAVGGASEVAMSCDLRIGATTAEFFMPENGIGLTISNASSLFLRRLVGRHATRIVLGSRRLGADEAHQIGLLDEVVATDELISRSIDVVHELTPEGGATAYHLALLRPSPEEVEAAIARENVAALEAWNNGVIAAGVERFWATKDRA
jgi:enoyl-CoA hydratase/carnithine racemase